MYLVRVSLSVRSTDRVKFFGAHSAAASEDELKVVQAVRYGNLENVFAEKEYLHISSFRTADHIVLNERA